MKNVHLKGALVAAGLLIPCAALLTVPGPDALIGEGSAYPVTAPFVWRHLVLIHIVSMAGFSWVLADRLVAGGMLASARMGVISGICAGLLIAILSTLLAPWLAGRLNSNSASFAVACAIKLIWAFLLVTPWMYAAVAARRAQDVAKPAPSFVMVAVILLLAIILPVAYQQDLAAKRSRVLEQRISEARYTEASSLSLALLGLRSDRPVNGQSLDQVSDMLRVRIEQLVAEIAKPFPASSTPQQRRQRAVSLIGLGEHSIAANFISADAERDLASAMLLATIFQDQREFIRSNRWYRQSLRMSAAIEDPQSRRLNRRTCYNALAYNYRELRQYKEAERIYREAQEIEPSDVPYFNLQLGKHYRLGGRPMMAKEHLTKAAEQDASLAQEAALETELMRKDSPGCFLGGPLHYPARR
jgi:tetratricopeptide (TPR) repeat protein